MFQVWSDIPFSLPTLLICVFSHFIFVNFDRDVLILMIFSSDQLFVNALSTLYLKYLQLNIQIHHKFYLPQTTGTQFSQILCHLRAEVAFLPLPNNVFSVPSEISPESSLISLFLACTLNLF